MRCTATVTSKGRVTIPEEVRVRVGLRRGDQVEFVCEGEAVVVRPVRHGSPFAKYVNVLGGFPGGREEINEWVRSLRDGEGAGE
jgi:AbrB family looped-hinge helix DNA binding protein